MVKEKLIASIAFIIAGTVVAYHVYSWFNVPSFLDAIASQRTTSTTVLASNSKVQQFNKALKTEADHLQISLSEPIHIVIPNSQIDLLVTESKEATNGSWPISPTLANFAYGTSMPNPISGNTVIFGHDLDTVFHNIHLLKSGDVITLYTASYQFTYTVQKTQVVPPTDIQIMAPTTKPMLTLFTCDGWFSQNRFAVFASYTNSTKIK